MSGLVRLRFITERFKSSDRTLLFYTPRRAPEVPVDFPNILKKLGDGVIQHAALHQQPFIKTFGGLTLDAFCDSTVAPNRRHKGAILIADGEIPQFHWKCDPDKWLEFATLVYELVKRGGHQYLRTSLDEDALVMVSRGEYYDEDFE